jgi:glutamine synthetase
LIESYSKIIHMEALTMLDMARQEILPAFIGFGEQISQALLSKRACALDLDVSAEESLLKKLSADTSITAAAIEALDQALQTVSSIKDPLLHAQACRKQVVPAMDSLRAPVDRLELIVAKEHWPMPTYSELLFST